MNVPQLLEEARQNVPMGAAFGTRWQGSAIVSTALGAHEVAVAARIDKQGKRREQFWCDGWRVELAVLLRLTCPETECPHAKQVRIQWTAFHHPRSAASRPQAPLAQPLMAEIELRVGHQRVTARPARFACFTPCPHGAHPPLTIEKSGFDLFEDSSCLGGGVVQSRGVSRPRIPTVQAAEAYVLARQLETQALLSPFRCGARLRPGAASEGE